MLYPVLSIRQPWAALILLGLKDVENRKWPLPEEYVGVPVLLHASKRPAFSPQSANKELHRHGMCILPCRVKEIALTGHILGVIVFGGCISNNGLEAPSRWCDRDAPYWWAIQAARAFRHPIPAPGHLRFWPFDLQP